MLEQHRRAKCIMTCITTPKRMAIILASRSGVLTYKRAKIIPRNAVRELMNIKITRQQKLL